MEPWVSLIGSVGFPIVACIALAVYVKEQNKQNREDVKDINAQHNEEMKAFKEELKEALNNNTIALTKLCEKLDERGSINEVN